MKSIDLLNIRTIIFFFSISLLFSIQVSFTQTTDKDDAVIITQSYPAQMFSGNEYNVIIRAKNTGTTIWTPEYYSLRQITMANSYENLWNITEAKVMSNIYPGAIETFSFNVKAPDVSGKYEFRWSMYTNGIYFGKATDSDYVTVIGPHDRVAGDILSSLNSAAFLNQVITDSMTTGMKYEVTVVMQNNGQSTWTKADNYYLSFVDSLINTDKNILNYQRIELSNDVFPSEQATFVFHVDAPSAPGNYNFAWIMKHGNEPFGAPSNITSVNVRKGTQESIDESLQK